MHRLDFLDYRIFDNHVQAIPTIQPHILIDNRQWQLLLDLESTLAQFKRQASLLGRLQQPRPQPLVCLDRRADDAPRDEIEFVFVSFCISQRSRRARR